MLNGTLLSYKYYISRFLSLDNSSQYFNSGVMLMDTGKIRTDGLCSEVFAMLQSGDYYCFEQCVLNKVFKNRLYKTAKMSHNARFALQDIFARLEDYMERKRKEEMFIENAG